MFLLTYSSKKLGKARQIYPTLKKNAHTTKSKEKPKEKTSVHGLLSLYDVIKPV